MRYINSLINLRIATADISGYSTVRSFSEYRNQSISNKVLFARRYIKSLINLRIATANVPCYSTVRSLFGVPESIYFKQKDTVTFGAPESVYFSAPGYWPASSAGIAIL